MTAAETLFKMPRSGPLHFTSSGVEFTLMLPPKVSRAELLACLPFGTVEAKSPTAGSPTFSCTSSQDLEELGRDLMVHVANHAPDRVFVHAGVVGWQGRALVLPGRSFAGKTTLVAALVQAGATYYSDEYAVVDRQGLVHPYARDLQMRRPGRPEQTALAVGELNGQAGTEALPVAKVVFAEFNESARWHPKPVSAGMAVLEMLKHTIPVQRTPARVMATLALMMHTATATRSKRGDAHLTAQALLRSMSADPPAA